MKVLAIEDDFDQIKLIRLGLSAAGIASDVADTVAKGVDLMSRNRYDIVVLDLMLPDGDGKELLVTGETTNWYRAKDPDTGTYGYIHKNFATKVVRLTFTGKKTDGKKKLGTLNVNGQFELVCQLPEGYDLQVVNVRGSKIIASIISNDMVRPQMYLTVAFDETYADVARMNDLTDADLAILEDSFLQMNQVEITYRETGYGTKLLVAREMGPDTDFVDILSIYQGYFIEFNMSPNEQNANKTLTEEQINTCIDFLTNLDFNPV